MALRLGDALRFKLCLLQLLRRRVVRGRICTLQAHPRTLRRFHIPLNLRRRLVFGLCGLGRRLWVAQSSGHDVC